MFLSILFMIIIIGLSCLFIMLQATSRMDMSVPKATSRMDMSDLGAQSHVMSCVLGLARRQGTYGIMTVGPGSQIYFNKSIYPIFNICPEVYLVFIGIELKLLRFSKISLCCLNLPVKFTGLYSKFHKKLRF